MICAFAAVEEQPNQIEKCDKDDRQTCYDSCANPIADEASHSAQQGPKGKKEQRDTHASELSSPLQASSNSSTASVETLRLLFSSSDSSISITSSVPPAPITVGTPT